MEKVIIYEGKETNYTVSDDGKVFNRKTNRFLKGTLKRNEYPSVQLRIDGKSITFMTHRLVAEAFCENPDGYTIVDHINRDKMDCRAENLRWVDTRKNNLNKEKKEKTTKVEKANIMKEWKTLPFAPVYAVSRDGEVANTKTGNLLIGSTRNGYKRVQIGDKTYSVHRLVYETYVGPINGYIDHINGDRADNRVENLRDVSQTENVKNTYERGRVDTIAIRSFTSEGELVKEYGTLKAAADDVGVTLSAVRGASLYGTKSGDLYWLRSDSITTPEEFNKKLGGNKKDFSPNSYIDDEGVIFSKKSKHCIPKFVSNNETYVYLIQNGKYQKVKI